MLSVAYALEWEFKICNKVASTLMVKVKGRFSANSPWVYSGEVDGRYVCLPTVFQRSIIFCINEYQALGAKEIERVILRLMI